MVRFDSGVELNWTSKVYNILGKIVNAREIPIGGLAFSVGVGGSYGRRVS